MKKIIIGIFIYIMSFVCYGLHEYIVRQTTINLPPYIEYPLGFFFIVSSALLLVASLGYTIHLIFE